MRSTMSLIALSLLLAFSAPSIAEAPRTHRVKSDAELAKALTAVKPGDTILLADGAYGEILKIKSSGVAGKPITIKAEHSRKAVFSRKGQAARLDVSYLLIDGLVFDSQYGDCTSVWASGKSIHFLDCEIRRPGSADGQSGGDGLQFFDSSEGLVEKCLIHHCLATKNGERVDSHGIRFTHSHDMTVRGCTIDLVSGDCVQVDPNRKEWDNIMIEGCRLSGGQVSKDDPYQHPIFKVGDYTSENAVDTKCSGKGRPRITIRDCDVSGFRGPIGNAAAFNIKEACEAVIDRCTIHDCEIGLRLRAPAHVRVTNCVLYDNDTHCRYEDKIPLLYLTHCTFGRVTGKGRGMFQEQRPATDLRVLGCLFLGDKPRQGADRSNRTAEGGFFVNVEKGDYKLAKAVPLDRNGPVADEALLKKDRMATPRPIDTPADAGAYQYSKR